MIKLFPSHSQVSLPFDSLFTYHRLWVDYQELFDESKRVLNSKCMTQFETPTFSDEIFSMDCLIQCGSGPYSDFCFRLKVLIPKDYPFNCPKVYCLDRISHQNINSITGEVFVQILNENEWVPTYNLCAILSALESSLVEPEIEYIKNLKYNSSHNFMWKNNAIFEKLAAQKYKNQLITTRSLVNDGFESFLKNKEGWNQQGEDRMNTEDSYLDIFKPSIANKSTSSDFYSNSGIKGIANKNPRKRRWISGTVPLSDLKKVKKTVF